ncbi:MAG: metallophosphoesterase [Promethearchaeota archaeon]
MGKKTKLFYATDVHGSEVTFKKFINAGKIYKIDVLILGGDITGKMIVPFVKQSDGSHKAELYGNILSGKTEEELQKVERRIHDAGYYPYRTTEKELKGLNEDKKRFNDLFNRLVLETLEGWVKLAEERLSGTGIKLYVTGGNDDIPEVSDVLSSSSADHIINPEEKVVYIDDIHEMVSTGYCNMTPWNCPRDVTDEELGNIIEKMMGDVKDFKNAIFNFHAPPYGTSLDVAPELDETLTPKLELGGGYKMISVGSQAVRDAILEYQPLLALHGHIHESRGKIKLGNTLCVNPGSEYGEGVLWGAHVVISDKKIEDVLFVSG